ncbi:MAG: hypothetical protein AAGA92_12730 [Planctomycetota bacterium]
MHTIRLRDPWDYSPAEAGGTWSRKFKWPAGPVGGAVVTLVLDPATDTATVTINGQAVAESRPGRYDISRTLADRNEARVASEAFSPAVRPFEARLEIEE